MSESPRYTNPLIGLFDTTSRIRGRLKFAFSGSAAVPGLNDMEVTVLAAVAEAATPPTVPRIGRALGHPRQVIQRAATSLINAGLIEARPNPDHKRAVLLVATAKGLEIQQQANSRADELVGDLLRSMDADLIAETNRNLEAICARIDAYYRQPGRN